MTDVELDRLAAVIAAAVQRALAAPSAQRGGPGTPLPISAPWLPPPVRPEPSARGGIAPTWTGAAQVLGDVAPVRHPADPAHRATTAEMTRLTRAAAAGKGLQRASAPRDPVPAVPGVRSGSAVSARRRQAHFPLRVKLGVSNRHLHLSPSDIGALFGATGLSEQRRLLQPGQFAANEAVTVVGPKGRIEGLRVVGPARGETQLEISLTDAATLGIAPPVAASGTLFSSTGGVTLIGPNGRVQLVRGVIVASRHLHCASVDAARWGLADGDQVDVHLGAGARQTTMHGVLVREGASHATELHLDADEARAAGVVSGDAANVVGWHSGGTSRRRLVTERDVIALAGERAGLPPGALLTPSARDRARQLGLLPHE